MRSDAPSASEQSLDALLTEEGRLPNMAGLEWTAAFETILLDVQTEGLPVDTTTPAPQPIKWYRKRNIQIIIASCLAGFTLVGTTAAVLGRDARTGQGASSGDINGWFSMSNSDPVDETKYWVPRVDDSEVLDLSASNSATVLHDLTAAIPVPENCPVSTDDSVPGTTELTKDNSATNCQDTLISAFLPGPKEFISEDNRDLYLETTNNFLYLYTSRAIDLWASQYVAAAKSGDTASQNEAKKALIDSISWPVVLQLDSDPSGNNTDAYEFDYLNLVIEAVKKDDPFYFEIAYLTAADNQYPTYVPALDWETYSNNYQSGMYDGSRLTAEEKARLDSIQESLSSVPEDLRAANPQVSDADWQRRTDLLNEIANKDEVTAEDVARLDALDEELKLVPAKRALLTIADHDFVNEMHLKTREQIITDWYLAHGKTR